MINEKYQFNSFLDYPNIAHGISTKAFGSMKNTESSEIERAILATFAQSVGIEADDIVCMQQVHSGNVAIIDTIANLRIPQTDALITNKKNIPLAALTADCLPILFYDSVNEVVGIAHAGYKGLLNNVIEHTSEALTSKFRSDPKDIIVGIGPSIETMCYEVGSEVIEKFEKTFPEFTDMYVDKEQKTYLDLKSIALQCLQKSGILKEHSEVMNICTKCDKDFYSYRGADGDKRFASIISLV